MGELLAPAHRTQFLYFERYADPSQFRVKLLRNPNNAKLVSCYRHKWLNTSGPGWTRTSDQRIMRPTLSGEKFSNQALATYAKFQEQLRTA